MNIVKYFFLAANVFLKLKRNPHISLLINSFTHINITVDFIGITYHSLGTACHKVCFAFLLPPEIDIPKESTLVRSAVTIIWFSLIF